MNYLRYFCITKISSYIGKRKVASLETVRIPSEIEQEAGDGRTAQP